MDLFNFTSNGAVFSDDRMYRYSLHRIWDNTKPKVMFIGLNPSTANEIDNDPTIRRVINFAKQWGYGGVYMLNLFAFITTYPENLKKCPDPIKDNDKWIEKQSKKCDKIVFAWGSFIEAKERAIDVLKKYKGYALVVNCDGSPRHPLYVKKNVNLIKFN
jgi:hypothetical protein